MFTFLAPAALLGMALLAIPIIVHLLKPRKMRQMPFSSLRWLKQTQQRLSRRLQWHQWLLFLLRAGLITALVLAIAKPLIYSGGRAKPVDRFVILDASRSMAFQPPGLPSSFEKAQEIAGRLVEGTGAGDRLSLLVTGNDTRIAWPLTQDAGANLPALQSLKPGNTDTHLASALPIVAARLSETRPGTDVELVFLTDNHQQSWQQSDVAAFVKHLSRPVRVQLVEVAPGVGQNGWIAGARLLRRADADHHILRVEAACVGDEDQERTLRIVGLTGIAEDSQPITLAPGKLARVDFKVPAATDLKNLVAELRLEPADALPSDDKFFVNLDPTGTLQVLLIEPAQAVDSDRGAGLYLRTALDALSVSGNHTLELHQRTPASVTGRDIQHADLVFLCGVDELTDINLEELETRVRAGTGLVLFLGPTLKTDFYNDKLCKRLQPAMGLLPAPLKTGPKLLLQEGNPGNLTGIRWSHPLLGPLYDPVLGDLPRVRFRSYASFGGPLAPDDKVLATIDGEVPAIIDHPCGAGRVLIFNTTANDDWSDLPRRKSFVPLVDRLLVYLSGAGARRNFTAGEAITLPLGTSAAASDDVKILGPGGASITPRVFQVNGRNYLHLNQPLEPGAYKIEQASQPGTTFVVNVGRMDSFLTPMDTATLQQWWSTPDAAQTSKGAEPTANQASFEVINADAALERFEPHARPWMLWPFLIFVGACLLAVETFVVHRLCPRVNPGVVESVVPGRGMLKPQTVPANVNLETK